MNRQGGKMSRLEWMHQKAVFLWMLLFLISCFFLTGCGEKKEESIGKIEYEVCREDILPKELKKLIEERKQHPFAMSYIYGEEMYVVVGYGAHDSRNLNVVVEDFYMTDKAAYLDTNLISSEMTPSDATATGECSMYPYIVIKCARFDAPIYYNAP